MFESSSCRTATLPVPLFYPQNHSGSQTLVLIHGCQLCSHSRSATPLFSAWRTPAPPLKSHHSATFTDQHSLNNQPSEKSLDNIPSLYQEHIESINHGTLHWVLGYMSFCYQIIIFFRMITVSNNSLYSRYLLQFLTCGSSQIFIEQLRAYD